MTKVVITDDLRIGVHPEGKEPPNEKQYRDNGFKAFEYHLANNRWKDEIVFFEGHDKDTVMMALGKQSTSFEESQELKFKPGIYSCEIPPFEVVEQWKHKGSYTWADGEPHSSIVGRVELEYRKIIRLK